MPDINKPMDIPELNLHPPITDKVRLSEDMQQTLALLVGYSDNKRKLLRASESGVLNVAEPQIKDIVHFTGSGANDEQVGSDTPCTEVMVMGHPDNTGIVWVRPGVTATTGNAWPLWAGDPVKFTLSNLNQLNMLMVDDGDIVIAAYTR